MGRLDDVTLEELHELKDQITEGKPRERVLAAIGRKQGDQLETLAERHGVVEKTIRNWLDRFENAPIEQAPHDAPRPGGPAKIEERDREQLFEQLQQPPTELGYDQQAWSAKILLHHIKAEFGVEYHENYAYELLKEAGLSLRTARPQHYEADPEEKADFQETVEKTTRAERQNCRYRRPVYQTCRNCTATWMVPNRLKSHDRDRNVLEVSDRSGRCHRRR